MIIWLASYPKSGNTYIRSFLSAYYFSLNGEFEFEQLKNIDQYPDQKFFDQKITTKKHASENWLSSQEKLKKSGKNFIFKTHSALVKINKNFFTTPENTLGIIYIIRDPRNIITSIKKHYTMDYDQALFMMLNKNEFLYDKLNKGDYSKFTFLGSWSNHYKSWISAKKYNRIIIKFEDLENNKIDVLKNLILFINKITGKNENKIDKKRFMKAIETTNFGHLKKKENKEGFPEAILSKKTNENVNFFNLGFENKWETILPKEIKMRLNGELKDDIKFWKYKL